MRAAQKYYNYANVSVFSREIKELPIYLGSKNRKIRDKVESRVHWYGGSGLWAPDLRLWNKSGLKNVFIG